VHIGRATGHTVFDELQKDLVKAAGFTMRGSRKTRKTGPSPNQPATHVHVASGQNLNRSPLTFEEGISHHWAHGFHIQKPVSVNPTVHTVAVADHNEGAVLAYDMGISATRFGVD